MTLYEKGARFERFLVSKFHEHGWISFRAAGSGIMKFTIPDIIAIKGKKVLIIECKSTKKKSISLKETIMNLKKILPISEFEIYIAIKFNRTEARFYKLQDLLKKKNFTISINDEHKALEEIIV